MSVNFTTHHLQIVFDKSLNPKEIVQKIESLGYGAKIYNAKNYALKAQKERCSYLLTLSVGFFATMNLMFIAIAKYASYGAGMDKPYAKEFGSCIALFKLVGASGCGAFFH